MFLNFKQLGVKTKMVCNACGTITNEKMYYAYHTCEDRWFLCLACYTKLKKEREDVKIQAKECFSKEIVAELLKQSIKELQDDIDLEKCIANHITELKKFDEFRREFIEPLIEEKEQKEYKLKLATMTDEEKSKIKTFDLDAIKSINPEIILSRPVKNNQNITCPFHEDRNPSFRWYHKTNSFHCFSCQAHGSIIDLFMKLNDCDFKTAIHNLSTVTP